MAQNGTSSVLISKVITLESHSLDKDTVTGTWHHSFLWLLGPGQLLFRVPCPVLTTTTPYNTNALDCCAAGISKVKDPSKSYLNATNDTGTPMYMVRPRTVSGYCRRVTATWHRTTLRTLALIMNTVYCEYTYINIYNISIYASQQYNRSLAQAPEQFNGTRVDEKVRARSPCDM